MASLITLYARWGIACSAVYMVGLYKNVIKPSEPGLVVNSLGEFTNLKPKLLAACAVKSVWYGLTWPLILYRLARDKENLFTLFPGTKVDIHIDEYHYMKQKNNSYFIGYKTH